MTLYLLIIRQERVLAIGGWPWDCSHGFVVRAGEEVEARRLASEKAGDEGADKWLSGDWSSCDVLLAEWAPGIIIRDFWSA